MRIHRYLKVSILCFTIAAICLYFLIGCSAQWGEVRKPQVRPPGYATELDRKYKIAREDCDKFLIWIKEGKDPRKFPWTYK